jgi:hypothetical protein
VPVASWVIAAVSCTAVVGRCIQPSGGSGLEHRRGAMQAWRRAVGAAAVLTQVAGLDAREELALPLGRCCRCTYAGPVDDAARQLPELRFRRPAAESAWQAYGITRAGFRDSERQTPHAAPNCAARRRG